MSVIVVEVLERSKQGRTEPYICRCDDDEVCFLVEDWADYKVDVAF